VRTEGDWEKWLHFFMAGVKETSTQAVKTTQKITHLFENDRNKISTLKRAGSALRVYHALQQQPILSIAKACGQTGLTVPTVTVAFEQLIKLDIVREMTGRKRGRLYRYDQYVSILSEGIG
jgi:Fic family protein